MENSEILNSIQGVETALDGFVKRSQEEQQIAKSESVETKNAIKKLGEQQLEIAQQLTEIEQSGSNFRDAQIVQSFGDQFANSDSYKAFNDGLTNKARFEVKASTATGSDTTVSPDRKDGVVSGAFQVLNMESLFPSMPTSSNAIEYVKESSFTNNAAETAEAGAKPETDIAFALTNTPVRTIAHWTKISKQLSADNAALAAYINTRMRYGVDLRVDAQLVAGDGTGSNLSGFLDAGNFTAHGYADASLGSTNKKLALIRKMIADCWAAGYPADHIVLNPADWAQIEIDAMQSTDNATRVSYNSAGMPVLFGIPVVQGIGMTADNVAVGCFGMAGHIHNREGVVVELSDSDGSNFTTNLITVRAERRMALTIERPAAIIAGDLTPV